MKQVAPEGWMLLTGAHRGLGDCKAPAHPLGVRPKRQPFLGLSVKQHFCEDHSFQSDKISTWYFAKVADVVQSFSAKKACLTILADHLA
jgi:hypothetical protein